MSDEPSPRVLHLGDFSRDPRTLAKLAALAVVVGAVGAFVARALAWLIALVTNLAFFGRWSYADASPAAASLGPWLLLVPAAGGLAIGLLARYGSEKIRGHGIPEALEAILIGRSRLSLRVAVLKPLASAISIGTGGPFGAEGPIIMTGGAFGSLFGQRFHLTAAERKTLLVAGAAAGMTAIFSAPVAAVLLAVELLLFEWRPRSFVPVAVACATAAALRIPLFGAGPVFPVAPHAEASWAAIAWSPVVGLAAGCLGMGLTALVYLAEDVFHRLPLHWMWWPVLGGAAVGAAGLLEPRVLGIGYESIRALLAGGDAGGLLLLLLAAKALAWATALGSGTSGGVLAPLLLMGGTLGAAGGRFLPAGDVPLWALAGMAATMGGTMRSPLTAIVFAIELTHDVAALPVLLGACATAHAVSVTCMRRSILTEKVARRGTHVAREYAVDPFALTLVSDVMDTDPPLRRADLTVAALAEEIARGDTAVSVRQGTILVDADGLLAGIVTRGDLVRALGSGAGDLAAVDAGALDPVVAYPDELVADAVHRMVHRDVGRLPVVDRADPLKVVGYLGRAGVMAARARHARDEHVRERLWPAPDRG